MFVQSEITLLRTEVAQLKSLLLAHKDCPVTIAQQRNAQMLSKYLNWKSCSKLIKQSITYLRFRFVYLTHEIARSSYKRSWWGMETGAETWKEASTIINALSHLDLREKFKLSLCLVLFTCFFLFFFSIVIKKTSSCSYWLSLSGLPSDQRAVL